MSAKIGWWLMGLPVGIRRANKTVLRYGPYRWGAWLCDRGTAPGEDAP